MCYLCNLKYHKNMEHSVINDETSKALQKDLEDFDSSETHLDNLEIYEQGIMSSEEWEKLQEEIAATDPLDFEHIINLETDKDGRVYYSAIKGTAIKPDKYYRDENKTLRINLSSKSEDRKRDEVIIYLNSTEKYIDEIIDMLPYGLIDKQITGIGATHLELHSKRNSIIVTPTRALALNKLKKEFLYVGSKEGHRKSTSKVEIKAYLNNPEFEYKKILVVADSIDKVIQAIQENGEEVYRNYFLLIDEIDTLQSDNHFRPVLSRVIDHYFKFKLLRRALLSATVREFTHPWLEAEPVTAIQSDVPLKRNINLFHSNNINSLLVKKIIEISNEYPSDKILIAYNSVLNILQTIRLLPEELHGNCAILCSEASRDEAGNYLCTLTKESNQLPRRINFMTCSYFAGIDIEDRYHLITVSNSEKVFSALPLNKITQIFGRCRIPDGILSDTVLYNHRNRPLKNLATYRANLSRKAQKVIDLLNAANTLKEGDNDLKDLFDRIHRAIIERATERLFEQQSFELVRETIDRQLEISYFNIDALYEKMEAYYKLYSYKEGLYNQLKKEHSVTMFYDESDNENTDIKEARDYVREESNQRLLNRLLNIIEELISVAQDNKLDNNYLDEKINSSKRKEAEFFKRIKAHYRYYDITFLANILYEGALKNKKYYRNLNNTLSFRVLEDNHPFKLQISQAFGKGKKYTSAEIADILGTIVKDQFFKTLPMMTASQSRMMNLFKCCVDATYTGGIYLVKGYKPKFNNREIPEPIRRIRKEEPAVGYFEINSNQLKSTNTFFIL